MQHSKQARNSAANGQTSTHTEVDFPESVKVDTFIQTLFLTVDSDPQAEEEWQRFNCNDTVRSTSPDFLKSLRHMFQDKPAGQYLVKVELAINMTTLDFEPKLVPEVDPDLEADADASYFASHATQEDCLATVGQTEATETTDLPWLQKTPGLEADAEFDPEKHF